MQLFFTASFIRVLIAVILFPAEFCLPAFGVEQGQFQGYAMRVWRAQDGLPDQAIQAFAQMEDGSLWIGTREGLLRFDGIHFTDYEAPAAPAPLQRGVNCLLTSKDGSLWIGTAGGGLLRYRDGRFQAYSAADGAANQFIRSVFQDRSGTIWIGSDQGLFRVVGAGLQRVDRRPGIPSIFVRSIVQGPRGHVWVAGTALLALSGDRPVRQYALPPGLPQNLITAMYASSQGPLWIGALSGLYELTRAGDIVRVPGLSAQVSALWQSGDGALWIGTIGRGLFHWCGQSLVHIEASSLPSNTVNAIFADREGNLWLGTGAGLVRLSHTAVSLIKLPAGTDSTFETLTADEDGTIWMATSNKVFRILKKIAKPYVFAGLPGLPIRTLQMAPHQGVWLGTDGDGLYHLTEGRVEHFSIRNGLANDYIRAILPDRDHTLWIGTDGGLTHLEPDGHVRSYNMAAGLAYSSVTALFEARNGDIWVGTSRGLTHITHGEVLRDAVTADLGSQQIWSINQDRSGKLWIGTSTGLYGWGDGTLTHLAVAQGLASNIIYSVLCDSKDNLWLGSPNAIARVRAADLDNLRSGAQVSLTYYVGSTDMHSAQLYGGLQPEGIVAPNGDVWYPSNEGAIQIRTASIVSAPPYQVRIQDVMVNGQQVPLAQKIVLDPGTARLEISYAVVHLGPQEGFRYRYQMQGLEPWNDVGSRNTAYYTHLPAGTYRFRAEAKELGEPGGISEADIVIRQKRYFYATPWFVALCVLLGFGIAVLLYRWRLSSLNLRLHAVSEERARVAREMHDTVIQGCVGVSALLEAALGVDDSEELLRLQLLNYATDQVRSTIDEAREAIWVLRGAPDSDVGFGSLCCDLARQMQASSGIPVRYAVRGRPFRLDAAASHELLTAVHEAMINAIRHAHPNRLDVELAYTWHSLLVVVRDDGCGFSPGATFHQDGHYGILGMRERVRLLRGALDIESRSGHGTTVSIRIRRKPWRRRGAKVANRNNYD